MIRTLCSLGVVLLWMTACSGSEEATRGGYSSTCTDSSDCEKGLECASGVCTATCMSDADCAPTGCSGQLCASESRVTTCEFRSEDACYQDPGITTCGCRDGQCAWDATDALKQCIADAGASGPSAR